MAPARYFDVTYGRKEELEIIIRPGEDHVEVEQWQIKVSDPITYRELGNWKVEDVAVTVNPRWVLKTLSRCEIVACRESEGILLLEEA
jgi:hypothetical protein